jgi:transglutaminase-like putative cysteine protease
MVQTLDSAGNQVTHADFQGALTSHLKITNYIELSRDVPMFPVFPIDLSAQNHPFDYNALDKWHLAPFLSRTPIGPRLTAWLQQFQSVSPIDTLTLLQSVSRQVQSDIHYHVRYEEGVYDAETTLQLVSGTCRDIASLFCTAVRALGFAARLTTGYLIDTEQGLIGANDQGALHAWCEVFVTGAGWIAFDPTNSLLGDYFLVPLASGIDLGHTAPVEGSYGGIATTQMSPEVQIIIEVL